MLTPHCDRAGQRSEHVCRNLSGRQKAEVNAKSSSTNKPASQVIVYGQWSRRKGGNNRCARSPAAAVAIWPGGPFGHTAAMRVRLDRRPFLLHSQGVRVAGREFPAAENLWEMSPGARPCRTCLLA